MPHSIGSLMSLANGYYGAQWWKFFRSSCSFSEWQVLTLPEHYNGRLLCCSKLNKQIFLNNPFLNSVHTKLAVVHNATKFSSWTDSDRQMS
uniref:Uncharacterized protein n=1 Tax=Anguilla anguilla TaxID=7936 RepID=A0A0E9W7G9_ANGAN